MARVLPDYSTKRYSNPLFQRRIRGQRGPSALRTAIFTFLTLLIIGAVAWFFIWSPFFRATDINVSGTERLSGDDVKAAAADILKERRWGVLPGDNLLTLSESELSSKLMDKLTLESAEVTKRPPKGLDIAVKERVSSIIFAVTSGTQALLDLDGVVMKTYASGEAPPSDVAAHRLIDDKDETFDAKERLADAATVQDVIDAPGIVHDVWNGAQSVAEIHIESKRAHTLRIVTGEGWGIYVDVQQPLRPQLVNAELVVRTKVGNDRPKLDYVDVRFNEKVFFKLK